MRNFWKRTNRGLLLGGVLVLGTSIYVAIDYGRFSNGREDMQKVLSDYAQALAQASVAPDSQAQYGYEKTSAEQDALYNTLSEIVKEYWTDSFDSQYDYYPRKADMLGSVRYLAYEDDMPGYITSYNCNISQLELKKNGPGAAAFTMATEIVIDSYGCCSFPMLDTRWDIYYEEGAFSGDMTDDMIFEDMTPSDTEIKDTEEGADDELTYYEGGLRTTGAIAYSGELLYEDGQWKISWIDSQLDSPNPFTSVPREGGSQ